MADTTAKTKRAAPPGSGLMGLLKPYRPLVSMLAALTILGNALNLVVPKLLSRAIDDYGRGQFAPGTVAVELFAVSLGIFVFTYLQNIVQTIASERVARDLRRGWWRKSRSENAYVQEATPAKLLTNLTSDVDAVKLFVSQAVASIVSSLLLIIGSSVLLLMIDWRLALAVLAIIPIIGVHFLLRTPESARALQERRRR